MMVLKLVQMTVYQNLHLNRKNLQEHKTEDNVLFKIKIAT